MTVSRVQGSTLLFADNASSIAPSLSGVTTGNNVVMRLAVSRGDTTTTAVTAPAGWNTRENTTTPAGAQSFKPEVSIFDQINVASGTYSGTISLPTGSFAGAVIDEITASTYDVSTNNLPAGNALTSANSGSITNTTTDALVLAIGHPESTGTGATGLAAPTTVGTWTNQGLNSSDSVHVAVTVDTQSETSSGARQANYTWTGVSYFAGAIVAYKGAAAGSYVPAPKTPQAIAQPPSMAPLMKFATAAATALAVTAGGYVPVGAGATQQTQVAYREAARLTAQPWAPDVIPQAAAFQPMPLVQPQPQPQAWPYAQYETWRIQPEDAQLTGITPIYLGGPRAPQIAQAAWPYGIATPVETVAALLPAVSQAPFVGVSVSAQQAWPYAQVESWRLQPEDAQLTGIAAIFLAPTPAVIVQQVPWPHASARAIQYGPATTIQAPASLPFAAVVQIQQQPWPYVGTMLPAPTASMWRQSAPGYFGRSPVNQWLTQPPWPHAKVASIPVQATRGGIDPPPVITQTVTPGFPYKRLPRLVWKDRPEPVIVQKDPRKSEITPEIHSDIADFIKAAKTKTRIVRMDDDDDDDFLLFS